MSNDISVDTSKVDTKRTGFNSNGNRNNFVKNQRKTNSNFSVTNHQEINMLQYPTYERSDGTHIWHQNGQKAAMNNNNGYGVELTSSMAQNSMPTNYGRYQVANGQFVGTMNSAPMFATVDVAGGYNAMGATYQQYYPFTQTVYNPAEIFQNQLAYATLPGAIAYNAPPPAAFSRPPPHLPTAQAQMIGNSTGQQTGYTNQAAATSMSENMNQYFNTNTQNTGSQPSSRFSTNNKVKQLSLFDNSSENYTASWVSSTSSIPPDLKVSPDHNSNPASPANEFAGNWTNEHGGASGSHPPLQHSSSVDEFAAGASATSGFSPPVDPSLDQQLNNMNATHNAAYSFPGQVQQIPTMNHSPVYFPTSVGQTYFPNSTGQSAYFPNSGTGQMMSKVSNLNDYQQVQHNATELGKKFEQTIQQQQHLSGNTNTGVTGSSSNTASWANVVKRSGNCSVGETRIRTVIAEPQQNLPQNQNTGISGNGNEHRSAGAVGDNRNRNNRNNSRYQGNSRNYNQNRIQTNNETSGQSNNTYSQRTNQNGGNRYTNQQTQGNNQYQNQRQISSDGNTKNEGNLLDTNKVRPLNATQIPPPNNMNINHMNVQQASSSPNIMPTMLTTAPVANFYMPPHSVATGFSPQNVQQQRNFQANQWNPTTPVPLAAINPAQQFISRPSPPVHNGPQQPTFSGMTQQFPQPASAPPGLVTPLYGNNQQLAPQKVNFKGSWLDQDMIPKDQTLMNYEMAMYVQNHNQNIAGWKAARMTTPNNPAIKNFSPQQGGLLYVILGSTNFPPRFGSPQQNPRVRRFRALHNQQIQRGKGGSPLKAYKKKSAKEEDENNPDEEKSTQEGEKDEDNKNEDENGVPEDGRKEAGYAGVDLEQKLSDVNLNGDK